MSALLKFLGKLGESRGAKLADELVGKVGRGVSKHPRLAAGGAGAAALGIALSGSGGSELERLKKMYPEQADEIEAEFLRRRGEREEPLFGSPAYLEE